MLGKGTRLIFTRRTLWSPPPLVRYTLLEQHWRLMLQNIKIKNKLQLLLDYANSTDVARNIWHMTLPFLFHSIATKAQRTACLQMNQQNDKQVMESDDMWLCVQKQQWAPSLLQLLIYKNDEEVLYFIQWKFSNFLYNGRKEHFLVCLKVKRIQQPVLEVQPRLVIKQLRIMLQFSRVMMYSCVQ